MFRHRVIMGTHKGANPDAEVPNPKESKRSPMKNFAMSDMQKSGTEEGVELNEESKIYILKLYQFQLMTRIL